MGYYSTVGISIKEKDYQKMRKNIQKGLNFKDDIVKQDIIDNVKELMMYCDTNYKFIPDGEKEVYRYLEWDCVKWYENTFAEIDYIMDFIRSFNDGYNFIRLGEEVDDTQEEINSDLCTIFAERSIGVYGKEIKEDGQLHLLKEAGTCECSHEQNR